MIDDMFRPFRRYADFRGRASRREYWLFILFGVILMAVIGGVGMALGWQAIGADHQWRVIPGADASMIDRVVSGALGLLALVYFVPTLAVQVRRFHDRNRSAWNLLWNLVPYIGSFVIFYMMVLPGTIGPNRYGRDPTDPLDEFGFVLGTRRPLDY